MLTHVHTHATELTLTHTHTHSHMHTRVTPCPGAVLEARVSVSRLLTSVSWPVSNPTRQHSAHSQQFTRAHTDTNTHADTRTHCFFFISKGSGAGNLPLPPSHGVRLDPSTAYTNPVNKQPERALSTQSHTYTHTGPYMLTHAPRHAKHAHMPVHQKHTRQRASRQL